MIQKEVCIIRQMNIPNLISKLKIIAPLEWAEDWDNVGLLVEPLELRDIQRILLTIDLTESVVLEAEEKQIDLIFTYHPILFRPIDRLTRQSSADRMLMRLVKNDIAVYSPHTALDAAPEGVNDWLAKGVGTGTVSILHPIEGTDAGQGRLVTFSDPVSLTDLTQRIKTFLGVSYLRIATTNPEKPIRTVALCAGAGSDSFTGIDADCYLTGEMSHHHALALQEKGSHVILSEHTHTERGFLPVLKEKLVEQFTNEIDILISERDADPIVLN